MSQCWDTLLAEQKVSYEKLFVASATEVADYCAFIDAAGVPCMGLEGLPGLACE